MRQDFYKILTEKCQFRVKQNLQNLKKSYEKGLELRGKTIGIVGLGRIGQEVARIALGLGMKVVASDLMIDKTSIRLDFQNNQYIDIEIVN